MNRQVHARKLRHRLPKTKIPPPVQQVPKPQTVEVSPSLGLFCFCTLPPALSFGPLGRTTAGLIYYSCCYILMHKPYFPLLCCSSIFHPRKWKEFSKTPNSCPFKWQEQHKIASGPSSYSVLVLHHKHLVVARLYQISLLFSALWFYTRITAE